MPRFRFTHGILLIALQVPRIANPFAILRLWHRRAQGRHDLARLDADQLRDVGLHPDTVRREAEKPFWEA